MYKEEGFKEIDHTADVALQVWGKTLSILFCQAALGLYAIAGVRTKRDMITRKAMHLEAEDKEELLVNFLSELLYQMNENRILYKIETLVVDNNILEGKMAGKAITHIEREIKAVTFYELKIEEVEGYFQTKLVLDV